jgi:hypothetical protein
MKRPVRGSKRAGPTGVKAKALFGGCRLGIDGGNAVGNQIPVK